MPYSVGKHDACPASKPYGVTNTQTGTLHGCHATKAKAQAQQRALYANEPKLSLTTSLHLSMLAVEDKYLGNLVAGYEAAIGTLAITAGNQFALTAAADWQPPPDGAIITTAEVLAVAHKLNYKLEPVWESIVTETAQAPLATIEISWDDRHPLAQTLLNKAGTRTGERLGEAVQYTLRETLAHAYENGLNVHDTSLLIRQKITDTAPFQAEMLARTDLNSLSNGASHAAAQLAQMGYKTWLATLDDKTRPEHAEAHGQTVGLNETFSVGGEDADYPGDPNLSDAMAAACRCTVAYGETLAEAQGLTAAGLRPSEERGIMAGMATKEQRRRRYERRAAHAQGKSAPDYPVERLVISKAEVQEKLGIVASPRAIRFDGTAAIEGQVADDNSLTPRVLLPDSLAWPEMPVSFMAQTKTAEGHDGAEVAGRVDEFARKNGMGRKRSIYTAGELTNEFGINEIAPMIENKTMRYVSADLGATEWCIVGRGDLAEVAMDDLSLEDLQAGKYALGLTAGKMKALTLLPTQALEGAMVALVAAAEEEGMAIEGLEPDELLALVAAGGRWSPDPDRIFRVVAVSEDIELGGKAALIASPAPVNPPRSWFETQEPPGKMPLTVTKDGRVYGHLATWDSCHASFLPQCVPPPKSPSNYARFHTGYLDTAEGDEISVGKLMFSPSDGGHADRRLSASKASAYYDKCGMAGAYLRATDGEYGIWVAGALNPDLSDQQREKMRRELRLNPPSGDWRIYDGQHDLLCGLAVAIPGFGVIPSAEVSIVASADGVELRDAIIASSGMFEPDPAAVAAMEHLGLVDEEQLAERRIHALAARAQGLDSLAALIE